MLASAPESVEELTSGTSYSPPPAFGRFKLLHQIGAGVLGPVFRTHDPDHERLVAVKAFTIDLTPEQASRLASEFGRLAALEIDAPCVAVPIAAGVEDFVPYAAVPYVSGESLDAAIRQYGPAPAGDAIRLIAHVADALDAAAHAGVHHGSLHPRDIIVTPGETHVTGLGVAQALERVGLHGPVRRPYVAPERESGDEWGAPADIYALAAIAYEVLTGRRALPGTDQPLPALNDLHVHDAAALRDAIELALDADPGRRPARARDFAAAVAAALSESAGAAAPGERTPDRRARKPRSRPPKLPGLDEPLTTHEGPVIGRPISGSPIDPVRPAPGISPDASGALEAESAAIAAGMASQGSAAAGDIRYVPVTDPADAGDLPPDLAAVSASLPEVPPEQAAAIGAEMEFLAALEPLDTGLAAGLTPDLRMADELLARADASRETVDAELAAALDRLSSDTGTGPTPAAIGLDILGPGPSAGAVPEDVTLSVVGVDLAAETEMGHGLADDAVTSVLHESPAEEAAGRAGAEALALDFSAYDQPAGRAEDRVGTAFDRRVADGPPPTEAAAEPEPAAVPGDDPAGAAEPLRPFVRGKGAERRRAPSRYSRIDALTPEPGVRGDDELGVPRAFDQPGPSPAPRPVSDFELLARPGATPRRVLPVLAGVAAGLIVGLAAGYWLGTRSPSPAGAPPGRVPPAQTAAASQQAPAPVASPGNTPTAVPAPATPAGAVPGAPAGTASTSPAPPVRSAAVPPAASEPAPRRVAPSAGASPSSRAAKAPAVKSVLIVLVTSTPPGALIRIDGRDLGPTPLTVRQLRPGTHTLELRMPGYKPWSQKLTVAAGDNRRVTASLERDNTR
ncbi:MAG: PEGA domain-containing protein [Vicinamibacterales bacterium]|jgi:serine/threonine protein kinase|nr:PEGA domain-containing protein [Vicinamibacterales bacterium]